MALVSIIAAMDENRLIGANNDLPWRLPADLKRVKELTTGHSIILGRRNYESIGRPLPNRKNIVVSRDPGYEAPGCTVVTSLEDAFKAAEGDEVFVFGGATLYEQTLAQADRMYLTLIHNTFEGDTFFPEFDPNNWHEKLREDHQPDAKNAYAYTFLVLEKK